MRTSPLHEHIRPATDNDAPFLRAMLYEAARWSPDAPREPIEQIEQVLEEPALRHYHAAWGRPGDGGVVAELDGAPIGAAWYRLLPAAAPGYGFVDEETPELSMAVAPEHRRKGVGSRLIRAAMDRARADGFRALSLSVAADNPARELYRRAGFVEVGEHGGSWTMRAEL